MYVSAAISSFENRHPKMSGGCRVKGDSSMSGKDGNSLRPKHSHSARINRNYIIYEDVKHYFEEEANKQD